MIIFIVALCELPGVGAKVADCVCLMSLDKTNAIPVDTHVWQISCRDYQIPELKGAKTLTKSIYKAIGNLTAFLWNVNTSCYCFYTLCLRYFPFL